MVHFNLLSNHIHFIVEADGKLPLARGMQGLGVRLARGINKSLERGGKLFAERYHSKVLRSPRQVRNALRYVLLNARHHAAEAGMPLARRWIDPYSSAVWFDGWRDPIPASEPWMKELLATPRPTAEPSRWLLTTGWRIHGLLGIDEVPGRTRSL